MSYLRGITGDSDRPGFGDVSTSSDSDRRLTDAVAGSEDARATQGVSVASFGAEGSPGTPMPRSHGLRIRRVRPTGVADAKPDSRLGARVQGRGVCAAGLGQEMFEGADGPDRDGGEDSAADALSHAGGGVTNGLRRTLAETHPNDAGGAAPESSARARMHPDAQAGAFGDTAPSGGGGSAVEADALSAGANSALSVDAEGLGFSSDALRKAPAAEDALRPLGAAKRTASKPAPANPTFRRIRARARELHARAASGVRSLPGLARGAGRASMAARGAVAGTSHSAAGPAAAAAACAFGCVMALLLSFLCLSVCFMGGQEPPSGILPEEVEQWRPWAEQACTEVFGDSEWATFVLCLMAAESGGDVNVSSVTGAWEDIMQASEGAFGNVVRHGATEGIGIYDAYGNIVGLWPYTSVSANTALASIYAGVLEFKMNLEIWEGWLGEISAVDVGKLGLVAQGYNYGAHGWLSWCKRNNVTSYSVEDSARYQQTLPAGLKGTVNHGEKVLSFYSVASTDSGDVVARAYGKLGCRYVWGATGPDTFDCSGLVGYCLTGTTVRIGTTQTFMGWQRVTNPQPGDICTTDTHCGVYIGGGQMIHAPHSGDVVKIGPVQSGMIFVRYSG